MHTRFSAQTCRKVRDKASTFFLLDCAGTADRLIARSQCGIWPQRDPTLAYMAKGQSLLHKLGELLDFALEAGASADAARLSLSGLGSWLCHDPDDVSVP